MRDRHRTFYGLRTERLINSDAIRIRHPSGAFRDVSGLEVLMNSHDGAEELLLTAARNLHRDWNTL